MSDYDNAMMRSTNRLSWPLPVLCLVLAAVPPAASTDVYRWVDDNGVVQFGERPPAQGAERIDIDPAAAGGPGLSADRRERQQRLLDSYAHERERRQENDAAAQQADRERAGRCTELRRYREFLDHGGPIYFEDGDGGRDYLSEERRQAERRRVQAVGARECKRVGGW